MLTKGTRFKAQSEKHVREFIDQRISEGEWHWTFEQYWRDYMDGEIIAVTHDGIIMLKWDRGGVSGVEQWEFDRYFSIA